MDHKNRSIAILIFDDVHLVDVAGPAEAFNEAGNHGRFHYDLKFFSVTNATVRASCGIPLNPDLEFESAGECDDVLITGGIGIDRVMSNARLRKLVSGWLDEHPGGRVLSVCSGALLLADVGVLQGKPATTHWRRSQDAQKIGGSVRWDFDRIFTSEGNVFCSAGVTAGIDLALHIIALDAGNHIASAVARELVVPMQRTGGQSQHSLLVESKILATDRLRPLIDAVIQKPDRQWTLDALALFINVTPRTLTRYMKKEFGIPPVKFVELVRLQFAANLIERGEHIQAAARKAGFGSSQRLNRAIKRNFDTTPSQLVRVLKSDDPGLPV